MTPLRKELPTPLPSRIQRLPVDARGYPVPVFVQWFHADKDRTPCEPGEGIPDFRVVDSRVTERSRVFHLCFICGQQLGTYKSFVAGSMCAVSGTSAEPPQHLDCATWSVQACPFLARPHARRRPVEAEKQTVHAPGIMLERNPGVSIVWTSRHPRPFRAGDGVLWRMGKPEHVEWWAQGRRATRAEAMESIDSGMPSLVELAERQRGGVERLELDLRAVYPLLPPETTTPPLAPAPS